MTPTMWHAGAPEELWDEKQTRLQAHFLQSRAWAIFQIALGRQVFYAFCDGWTWVAILEKGRFGTRLYCPYGPTARDAEAMNYALAALQSCARSQGVSYLRIEPQGVAVEDLRKQHHLTPAHRNIQPHFTLMKDLTPPEDELLAEMTATNRNLHRTAPKKGLSFRKSTDPDDIQLLLSMLHEVADKNKVHFHEDAYFILMARVLFPLGAASLFIAELAGQPVATSLVFDSATTRYYAHAASRAEFRKLHPGTPLVSHMIFDAKAGGKTAFDFYGVAPPNQPDHPWAGFTAFKQSFGGHIVDLQGTWELPVKKFNHLLYRTLTKLGK